MTPATKRRPRKDNLARLAKLLNEWVKEEAYATVIYGAAGIGSARARRVLDAAALRDVLAYFDQP